MEFKSVKIIHDIIDRIDFLFLAEFFRFCGLYVAEETVENFNPHKELENNCFNHYIWISDRETIKSIEDMETLMNERNFIFFNDVRRKVLLSKGINQEIRNITKKNKELLLLEVLDRLYNGLDRTIWQILVNIYVDSNIMIHSTSLQYYPKRGSDAIENAGEGFHQAFRKIEKKIQTFNLLNCNVKKDKQHICYAKLWCAVKTNVAYKFENKRLFFEPEELAEECRNIYAMYPAFSNIKVLEGLCYEYSPDRAADAIDSFNNALACEKKNCYANAIYYWIGKKYEAHRVDQDVAIEYYYKAYQAVPKFRNIYKLAIYERSKGNIERTQEYFGKIINILIPVARKKMLDPLELEYAFKTYQQLCQAYFYLCDDVIRKYERVIYYAEEAMNVKKLINSSNFYQKLYGRKANNYRKISESRMNLNGIYLMLSKVYDDLKEYALAEEYRKKIEKYNY